MIKACLFDLDGTLLPLDTESFVRIYLKELAGKVKHLIAPDQLIQTIWEATEAMIKSGDGTRTNEQIFEREFLKRSGLDREIIWPLFNQFYEQDFPKLSKYTKVSPLSRKVVQAAVDHGYKVAVATNPVFPKAAIMERLKWAGINDLPFQWVTVYEECRLLQTQSQILSGSCRADRGPAGRMCHDRQRYAGRHGGFHHGNENILFEIRIPN